LIINGSSTILRIRSFAHAASIDNHTVYKAGKKILTILLDMNKQEGDPHDDADNVDDESTPAAGAAADPGIVLVPQNKANLMPEPEVYTLKHVVPNPI
jgi:hypothetical protein